jgi:Zn-dependent M16 (insulinase) family peptidase
MPPEEADDKRGYLLVLQHLLSTDYLWQNIRVLGGAYGCMLSFDNIGTACMVSYRDPNLDETIACVKKIVEYIRSLDIEERDFRQVHHRRYDKLDKPKSLTLTAQRQFSWSSVAFPLAFNQGQKAIISATLMITSPCSYN